MDRIFTCLGFLGILWLQINARVATECDKFDQRVDECWNKHTHVPVCQSKDKLMACNEDNVARMPSDCPTKIKTKAQQVLGVSQLLHRIVCARRSDILEEFISRPRCWEKARVCLQRLPISFEEIVYRFEPPLFDLDSDTVPLADREKVVATECYEEGEAIHLCYSRTVDCDYLEDFINLILDNSMCRSYRFEDCPVCAHNNSALNRLTMGEDEEGRNSADISNKLNYIFILTLLLFYFTV